MSQIYQRVALIGLGLIASSMYWSIKRSGVVGEVVGLMGLSLCLRILWPAPNIRALKVDLPVCLTIAGV